MILASCGITRAARNIQPIFCLTTGGKVIPSLLSSVIEKVFDSPLSCVGTAIPQVHLLQEPVAPEEVTPEATASNTIPPALVPAPYPICCLSRHTLGEQVKGHNIQDCLQAAVGVERCMWAMASKPSFCTLLILNNMLFIWGVGGRDAV